VLAALAAVPRHRFTPSDVRERAYDNVALPIACGQTISQPIVVARMLALLRLTGSELVLDVGTGSGYHAALLARLAARVCSIERHAPLSGVAAGTLTALGIENVELFVGDGSDGLPARAPFDAINVAAAIPAPVPAALVTQLAPGGRLVAPVSFDPARPEEQRLVVVRAGRGRVTQTVLEPVRFVPLVSSR
jgi:protein-L-isoaspartate(D-aspartate) O-methyltransferase